ncbi:matrixin family metalloprotease [Scytonema sp. HK-05]|uniref:matrixin family metalloprotease n=1 Tax=Scytonema sp. HK-05 TaxID=1137095 RepID=UPI000935749E|nr:matrixin family metalloprotease [Scytonema sp. HK-05]OKH56189.1 hypothetical protein NIES2130_25555 [Scytonema sp. HK-05]
MPNERSFTSPSAIGLQMGASGQDVTVLQVFLRRFGYLQETRNSSFSAVRDLTVPDAATGTFDNATEEALRSYQQFHGLPVTGELDQATVAEMRKPRCGFPDRPSAIGSGRFVAQGNRWDHTNITYRIVNFTADLTQAEIRTAVRQAFDLWIAVVPLTFTEVTGSADILISFVTGDHGDGDPFDGMGNVLAHAYYPPPNGGDIAGDAHFDDAETWTVNVPVPAGGWDLITIAAHEFGHSLGLDHTNIANALMFPTFPPGSLHRFLAQDDIDGIQSIYGRRPQWQQFELAPAGSASTSGGITAVSRIPNSMEVWWVGANGSVQDAFWYEGGQWQQFELAPAGSASTSGGITAVSRIPNSMEVWWIGADGSVQDAFWYEGGEWRRFTLASADNAPANGEITAVSRISNSMEVWWIGANGSVRDAYWYDS